MSDERRRRETVKALACVEKADRLLSGYPTQREIDKAWGEIKEARYLLALVLAGDTALTGSGGGQ